MCRSGELVSGTWTGVLSTALRPWLRSGFVRLSFVIPAHNEVELLPRALAAIDASARATGLEHEILVVDDSSEDGTADVAQALGARALRVSYRNIAATRNAGSRQTSGDILFFVDADTCVSIEAIAGAVKALARGAVGGGARVRFDGRVPLDARVGLATMNLALRLCRWAAGCFVFCTRAAFEAVGGFDQTLFASEEIALSRALKRQGRFVILRTHVVTSGRKVRSYSRRETAKLLWKLLVTGGGALRSREHLQMWYGVRRRDPGDDRRK